MSEITKAVLDMPMDIAVCGHIASVQYWLASQARITQLQADLKASQSDCKRVEGERDRLRALISEHNGECDFMCNPEVCGYDKYPNRSCSACPKDFKIGGSK